MAFRSGKGGIAGTGLQFAPPGSTIAVGNTADAGISNALLRADARWLFPAAALVAALGPGGAAALSSAYERRYQVNVKNYGAVGDGATNDTAAINAAIAALTPGDTLLFPPGRYMTNGGHTITTPSVVVRGPSGRAQTYNSSAQLYLRNGANATMLTIAANQVTLRDLALYGNYANQSGTSHGLVINDGSNYLLFDAVWIDSFHNDGLVVGQTTGTQSGTITNCEARVNQGYGMKFNGGGTDTIVSRSYVDQNGLSGVLCSAGDVSFSECHIWGNGTLATADADGMRFASSSGCRVVNCYVETNIEGTGIRYATGTKNDHEVIGCDIWGNGFNGIAAFQVTNLRIIGNTIRQNNYKSQVGSSGAGVGLDGCTDFIVSGNTIYSPSPFRQSYAYYEANACSNGLFANNVARAATHANGDIVLSTAGAVPTIVRNNIGPADAGLGALARTFAASDAIVNNTTAYSTVLSLPIKAGQKYIIRGAVNVDGSQTADLKLRLQATSSTGASGWFGITGNPAGSNTSASAASFNPTNAQTIAASGGSGATAGLLGVGTRQMMPVAGYLEGGSVDGTLDLQFGQGVADPTDTTFRAGSWLELVRVV